MHAVRPAHVHARCAPGPGQAHHRRWHARCEPERAPAGGTRCAGVCRIRADVTAEEHDVGEAVTPAIAEPSGHVDRPDHGRHRNDAARRDAFARDDGRELRADEVRDAAREVALEVELAPREEREPADAAAHVDERHAEVEAAAELDVVRVLIEHVARREWQLADRGDHAAIATDRERGGAERPARDRVQRAGPLRRERVGRSVAGEDRRKLTRLVDDPGGVDADRPAEARRVEADREADPVDHDAREHLGCARGLEDQRGAGVVEAAALEPDPVVGRRRRSVERRRAVDRELEVGAAVPDVPEPPVVEEEVVHLEAAEQHRGQADVERVEVQAVVVVGGQCDGRDRRLPGAEAEDVRQLHLGRQAARVVGEIEARGGRDREAAERLESADMHAPDCMCRRSAKLRHRDVEVHPAERVGTDSEADAAERDRSVVAVVRARRALRHGRVQPVHGHRALDGRVVHERLVCPGGQLRGDVRRRMDGRAPCAQTLGKRLARDPEAVLRTASAVHVDEVELEALDAVGTVRLVAGVGVLAGRDRVGVARLVDLADRHVDDRGRAR